MVLYSTVTNNAGDRRSAASRRPGQSMTRTRRSARTATSSAPPNGQARAYVFEPGRRALAKLLTRDEARRIAANAAKLPDLLCGVRR